MFGWERPKQNWGKLRNMDLHNLYSLPHGMLMVELRRMTWVGHVARLREKINTSRVLVGRCRGVNLVGDADVVVFVLSACVTVVY